MSAIDPENFRHLSIFFDKVKEYLDLEYGIVISRENRDLFNSYCSKSYWGGDNPSNAASWFVQESNIKGIEVDDS